MRIAVPVANGQLNQHFGHSPNFAFVDVEPESREITQSVEITAPEHVPGQLPPWLREHGVTHVIAGNLGARARMLLGEASIEIVSGAPSQEPVSLVRQYLDGTLATGEHTCNHNCQH